MPTPDELRALADEYLRRAEALRRAADRADAILDAAEGLSQVTDSVTIAPMQSTAAVKKHRGPEPSDGPMDRARKALGLSTLLDLAKHLGEPYHSVRSWNHRKNTPARVSAKLGKSRKT